MNRIGRRILHHKEGMTMKGYQGGKSLSKKRNALLRIVIMVTVSIPIFTGCSLGIQRDNKRIEITNVSYDPTREFYEEFNKEFITYWKDTHGQSVIITQSHGGSGKQGRSVIEGNEADVVTLALAYDINAIQKAGLIEAGWQNAYPFNSAPYTSTIVFLVRKSNPLNIKDWDDLIREEVGVITPNPKTSGGSRWNYLAAWAYANQEYNGDQQKMKEYIAKLYRNVLVLDSGARGATTTFVENGQGDVLLTWESEAFFTLLEYPEDYEIIIPSISVLAETPVAVVNEVVRKRGTKEVAEAYLEYLYSDRGQRIAGNHYYRPSNPEIAMEYSDIFNFDMKLITIDDAIFEGWDKVQETHFRNGGLFDQIYTRE